MATQSARKLTSNDYTVGWICALPLELTASEGMLDKVHEGLHIAEGDKNKYILGEISGHNIAMACLPAGSIGQTSAATVAADMMHSFPRIRFGLMVGIGGGVPNPSARADEDIRLGDVVVSIPKGELGAVIKYDRGKVVAGGEFQHTGILNVPPSLLTTAVSALQCKHETLKNAITRNVADMIQRKNEAEDANLESLQKYQYPGAEHDQLFEADYEHVEQRDVPNSVSQGPEDNKNDAGDLEFPCPHCDEDRVVPRRLRRKKDPVIHHGTIASADVIMRHGETREKLRKKYGILCFEMEAAGLMNDFPCLVIRGICDYSDTHKHKIWQRYAAATAAAYAKELLGTVQKPEVIESRSGATKEEIDEMRQELEDMKKGKCKFQGLKKERDEILNWLDSDTHTKKWADSRMKWHRNTGKTFLESQSFLDWTNNHAQTLWCHGIAGSGKTIFASLVVDHLHAAQKEKAPKEKAAVVCLYLEYERMQEQSLQSLLAAILRQLVHQCPELPRSVTELHNTHTTNRSQPLLDEISSVLVDVIRKFPDVFLVVDALDECFEDTARDLLSNLRDHQKSTGLKLLATSRPTIDLGEFFEEYRSLEIKALEHDVRAVLDTLILKLPKLVREDKNLQSKIKNSIVEAVDGMFVLVEPFLYSLRSERTVGDINDALRALKESPDKISTVYERTLKRIDGHTPKDQEMAQRILAWIILAKRPLSCQEFQHALNVRIGKDFDKDYFRGNIEESVALCGGLVVINKKSDSVQLMHHTAKIYFKNPANQPNWICSAKEMIASACVTYISFSAFSAGPCSSDEKLRFRLRKFPFLAYAAQEWGNHIRESDEAMGQAEDLALLFLKMESNIWSSHQVLHLPVYRYPGYSQHFTRKANGLQLAASFGLTKIVRRLLEMGGDITTVDGDGGTALHRAAENGHVDVVLLLLQKGVDIDLQKKKNRHTALHLAALNGHGGVVKALLEEGAHANVQDDEGWNALHVAAWTGKKDAVDVLLDHMDVHERGKDGVTALHCAAGQGQRAVAELLINRGANVNTKDTYGWTALHWASKKRHDLSKLRQLEFKDESTAWREQMKKVTKVTGMLRDTFNLPKKLAMIGEPAGKDWQDDLAYASDGFALDLNTNDRGMLATLYFSTKLDEFVPPWLLPKQEEQIPTVRLILAVQDELAALQCLVQCGHGAVAKVLLDNGADVNAKCRAVVATRYHMKMNARPTALHIAGLSGHEPMAQMLLDRGADTESLCEVGIGEGWLSAKLTALHCAVVSGNKEAVRLFLDKGADINAACHLEFKNVKARITSLHLAVIWGHPEVVKLLLTRGVRPTTPCYINTDNSAKLKGVRYVQLNLNLTTEIELPILHLAAVFGNRDVIQELLQGGADCTSQLQGRIDLFNFKIGALHVAAFLGHVGAVDLLLTHGASVDANAELVVAGNSRLVVNALQLAALSNSKAVLRKLLGKGANVHAKGQVDYEKYAHAEWTALHFAALGGDAVMVGQLLEAGADVHAKLQGNMDSWFPLTTEDIMERTVRIFGALLGGELTRSSALGKTSTLFAGQAGQKTHFELNAIHLAAISEDDTKAKVLLKSGADVNSKCIIEANDLILEAMPVHLAAIWHGDNVALRLVEAGALVDAKLRVMVGKLLHLEMTPLHLAALVGDKNAVVGLFLQGAANTSALICVAKARIEMSAIHFAAIKGSTSVTRHLLMNGSNVAMQCSMKFPSTEISLTPIHIAAALKHIGLLDMLLRNGADANQQVQVKSKVGNSCITPLHLALILGYKSSSSSSSSSIYRRDQRRASLSLLDKGADISVPFRVDFIPKVQAELSVLHLAAMAGDWKVMEELLERGADAAIKGSLAIHKARLDASLLPFATLWKRENVVKSLIKAGADVNEACCLTVGTRLKANITALHLAALTGNESIVRILLQNGAIAHLGDKELDGSTTQNNVSPLHLALLTGKLGVTKLLIAHGANVLANLQVATETSRVVLSTLNMAIPYRDITLIKLLVEKGVDVNATSVIQVRKVEVKFTALNLAAFMRIKNTLVYLLKHGADVKQSSQINLGHSSIRLTPLHLATLVNGRKLVRVLLKYKADACAAAQFTGDKWFITWTPLHLATVLNATSIAELLLNNGAQRQDKFQVGFFNINAELKAIHFAIARGSREMVNYLLGKGHDYDTSLKLSTQNLGAQLSALHLALLLNRGRLVKQLFAKGVDIHANYTVGVSKKFQAELSAFHLTTLSGKDGIPGLFENGVDIHAKSLANVDMIIQFELEILDIITIFGTKEVTESLLEKAMQDQDKQHSGPGRNLALYLATALGYKTLLKLLLERMDEVDEKLSVKIQATVDAAFEGKLQNQVSAVVELKIETELSVLHLATVLGNIDAAKLLIDKGADINAICQVRLEDGLQANLTPLMLAAMWKHDGMVQLLLEKGAKVSQTGQARIERTFDTAMATPHLSAMLGHEGVKRILKKADSMEAKIEAELTGLHLAVLLDDVAVVSRFLEHGADPDMLCQADVELKHRDDLNANFQMQLMPLHLAAWAGHESVAALLVKGGAEVDAKIQAGGTAALEFGMRIDQKMKPGGTALHVAVGLGKEKVAQVLIENGADVGAKTRDGRTAVQWAHGHDGECIRNSGIERSLESVSKDMKTGFVQKLRRVFQPKNGS